MVSTISQWSTTAANNTDDWNEGMPPSKVNDSGRSMEATLRNWYETAEWTDLGHVPTYVSGTSFTVPTDLTTTYQVGRRLKMVGSTPFTLYGTIATSSYSNPNTTVTVTMDSGTIDSNITAISVSINSVTNKSISTDMLSGSIGDVTLNGVETLTNKTLTSPIINEILDSNGNESVKFTATASAVNEVTIANAAAGSGVSVKPTGGDTNIPLIIGGKGNIGVQPSSPIDVAAPQTIASATTCDISVATSNNVTISGTTTITGFGTTNKNCLRYLTFSGILTLTHNATTLILPSAANITTAAGDSCIAISDTSGNWKILNYQRADGTALVVAPTVTDVSVVFDGTTADDLSGTYSRTGTTVTVTATAHGHLVGHAVYADFTSGTATDGWFTVTTVADANTFTFEHGSSGATSGNITLTRRLIRGSSGISNVPYENTGLFAANFLTGFSNANYRVASGFTYSPGVSAVLLGRNKTVAPTTMHCRLGGYAVGGSNANDTYMDVSFMGT